MMPLQRHFSAPTSLCRWVIHLRYDCLPDFEAVDKVDQIEDDLSSQDPSDDSTWIPWPASWEQPPLQIRMKDALEHNDFSTINPEDLPVAVPQIVAAAKRSTDKILAESLGFAIMSRNTDQVAELLSKAWEEEKEDTVMSIYPLHLAAIYLDGSRTCCDISQVLLCDEADGARFNLSRIYANELGHTVLDSLMITILKSHSSAPFALVDPAFRGINHFPGEEIDICGRWDADSDCVRQVLACGDLSVPFSWKHKFCHTSTQAVVHYMLRLDNYMTPSLRKAAIGLYQRRCFECGMKLQLLPLHALVTTAYHVATRGCHDEDLFGMVACLLCLVYCEHDPRLKANISVAALLREDDQLHVCDHEELLPSELAKRLSKELLKHAPSPKIATGWAVLCGILHLCQENFDEKVFEREEILQGGESKMELDLHFIGSEPPDAELKISHLKCHMRTDFRSPFGNRKDLASLWAAVQAELVTYRRLEDGCEWLSEYFSMADLQICLEQDQPLSVRVISEGLLRTHCVCGTLPSIDETISTLPDSTSHFIANLDIWQRTTYLHL